MAGSGRLDVTVLAGWVLEPCLSKCIAPLRYIPRLFGSTCEGVAALEPLPQRSADALELRSVTRNIARGRRPFLCKKSLRNVRPCQAVFVLLGFFVCMRELIFRQQVLLRAFAV